MMMKVSKYIAQFLVKNGADPKMEEVYEYALICLLNELLIDFLLLIGAWFIGAVGEMVLWIIVFNSMRMNIGGFHAMTPTACSIYSVALGWSSVWLGKHVEVTDVCIATIFMICFWITYKMAPLLNPNHPLSEEKKKNARNRGMIFLGLWGILSFVLAEIWKTGVSTIVFAVGASCLLLFLEHVKMNVFLFRE